MEIEKKKWRKGRGRGYSDADWDPTKCEKETQKPPNLIDSRLSGVAGRNVPSKDLKVRGGRMFDGI